MPICIAGMHRSGTSMFTRFLNLCGVHLGDPADMNPAASDNPEGYWENIRFLDINDRLLTHFGASWDWPSQLPNVWEGGALVMELAQEATDLVQSFHGTTIWGWKDPRSSLTLGFWKRVVPDLKVLVCLRDPVEVAQSLSKRANSSKLFGINLWAAYNEAVVAHTTPEQRIVTHFHAGLYRPKHEIRRVCEALGIPCTDELVETATGSVKESLYHNRMNLKNLREAKLPEGTVRLYAQLCSEAGPVFQELLRDSERDCSWFLELGAVTKSSAVSANSTEARKDSLIGHLERTLDQERRQGKELQCLAEERESKLKHQLESILNSRTWKVAHRARNTYFRLFPEGRGADRFVRNAAKTVRSAATTLAAAAPQRLRKWLLTGSIDIEARARELDSLKGPGPAFLLVSHLGGGGIEKHLRDLSALLEKEGVRPLLLRPNVAGTLRLERFKTPFTPNLCYDPQVEFSRLREDICQLGISHIHVHSVAGHPPEVRKILEALDLPYDLTIHDYYTICPRIHLYNADSRYCGEPSNPQDCNACLAKNGAHYLVGKATDIQSWRAANASWVTGARRVFVPNADVAERLGRYFPEQRFHVRPHFEAFPKPRKVSATWLGGRVRVMVLGAFLPLKGSQLLRECARDSLKRSLPLEYHVIGEVAAGTRLEQNVFAHGRYTDDEVFDVLQGKVGHCALFLSTIPETHCYTLSIALRGGLYPIGLDVGAIAKRIRDVGWGCLLPLDSTPEEINDGILKAMRGAQQTPAPLSITWPAYPSVVQDYYGFSPEILARLSDRGTVAGGTKATEESVNAPRAA
jgi:hypothetical protein